MENDLGDMIVSGIGERTSCSLSSIVLKLEIEPGKSGEDLSRVACFSSCSVREKYEILGHFYFMRGHSSVELTEHDDSAADIILQSM